VSCPAHDFLFQCLAFDLRCASSAQILKVKPDSSAQILKVKPDSSAQILKVKPDYIATGRALNNILRAT
jgi:hypothetical protein